MNEYQALAATLQSRISKRAAKITENDMWRRGYRSLNRMKDWNDTKDVLKALTKDQQADKRLLKIVREVPKLHSDVDMLLNTINELVEESI